MPPSNESDHHLVFTTLKAALQALASVLPRNVELILHDLRTPEQSVVAIANGHLSGRTVGSPILAAPEQDLGFKALMRASGHQAGSDPVVIPDYPTHLKGRSLRSATALFRDHDGVPFASLCVNTDVTGLDAALDLLQGLHPLGAQPAVVQDATLAAQPPADMAVLMSEIIDTALRRSGRGKMDKAAKVDAVRLMQARGLFIVKGGVEKAAAALGVTRFTVYNYLDQLRAEADDLTRAHPERSQP
ncbi:transcriptional regulator [Enterobacterales bacterium AW_CKDN230030176-1A_HGKHYDSX7]